ncbi:MAG: hypothetical protein O2857_12650 [Planctomycetota bacterium]|nr:hypothetical protein [Planctomycetota bacterium]
MNRKTIAESAIACGLFIIVAGLRAEEVKLLSEPGASQAILKQHAKASSVFASDLARENKGQLFEGESAAQLDAGRYRLHAMMALSPLGDVVNSTVSIRMSADDASRGITSLHFPVADEFTPVSLDFIQRKSDYVSIRFSWEFEGKAAEEARLKAAAKFAPKTGGKGGLADALLNDNAEEDEDDDLIQLEMKGGRIPLSDAKQVTYRLMLAGFHIERLSPIDVTKVQTNRTVYKPGETGTVDVALRNTSSKPEQLDLVVELVSGLESVRKLQESSVQIAAGGLKESQFKFDTTGLYWGCEIRVTVSTETGLPATAREIFSVASNPWDVALIAAGKHTAHFSKKDAAEREAEELRSKGFTGFECFFWAPCDFIDFTPAQEKFFSGQTGYPGTLTGTKNLIDACHAHGMVGTVYANLWGGSGPPIYEAMQQHPEWFGPCTFNTHVLDDWELMAEGRVRAPGISHWCNASLRLNPSDDTFRQHAGELIESHRQLGWDGVRYDSYYSRYWNMRAMSIIREQVDREVPEFIFGYNSFALSDHQAGALPIMCSGSGGMVMAEGIRVERTNGYAPYADELLRWRDVVWPYGGHLGPLYPGGGAIGDPGHEINLTTYDQFAYSSIILATGAHAYYHPLENEIGGHQWFARRYSEFIYNNRMRPLANPEAVISFDRGPEFFRWKNLARTVTLEGNRRRLIVHLLNLDPDARPADLAMPRHVPVRDLGISLNLPAGAKVNGAWSLKAFPEPHHTKADVQSKGNTWVATVDEVLFYSVLVVDYESETAIPSPITPKELSDTYLQHWQLVGTFENKDDEEQTGFAADFGPEKGYDPQATYDGSDGTKVRWHPIHKKGSPPLGWPMIDLRRHFEKKDYVCAYAYTSVVSDQDREAVMVASFSDSPVVWLNGEKVFEKKHIVRDIKLDMHRIPVQLKKGQNAILMKVCQVWLSWGFYVRLEDKNGRPLLEGMKYGLE